MPFTPTVNQPTDGLSVPACWPRGRESCAIADTNSLRRLSGCSPPSASAQSRRRHNPQFTSYFNIPLTALLFSYFSSFATASHFAPNCTVPPEGTNFVSGPNVRGTLQILWTCASIFILCTWSILHLNIPATRPHTERRLQKVWWSLLDSTTKLKWMLLNMLMPEYITGKAFNELLSAGASASDGLERVGHDKKMWSTTHSHYANMGGFVLDFSAVAAGDPEAGPVRAGALSTWQDVQACVAECGASAKSRTRINCQRMEKTAWALNAQQLFSAHRSGLIARFPNMSATQLSKLADEDTFVKLLALLQSSYAIAQLIYRFIVSLPSSQLEVAAVAYAASSLVTYTLYWSRPRGIRAVTVLPASRLPTEEEVRIFLLHGPSYIWTRCRFRGRADAAVDFLPMPNDASSVGDPSWYPDSIERIIGIHRETIAFFLGAVVGGSLFGGLHCLAWNFQFPTQAESLLWRIASVMTAALPLASVPLLLLWTRRINDFPVAQQRLALITFAAPILTGPLLIAFLFSYVVARLFLLCEMFRSLFFLPPGAFVSIWSQSFPHFG